jgi:hypothetical protein
MTLWVMSTLTPEGTLLGMQQRAWAQQNTVTFHDFHLLKPHSLRQKTSIYPQSCKGGAPCIDGCSDRALGVATSRRCYHYYEIAKRRNTVEGNTVDVDEGGSRPGSPLTDHVWRINCFAPLTINYHSSQAVLYSTTRKECKLSG